MCNNPDTCKWGEDCRYAHSEDELKTLKDNADEVQWSNYRTRLCVYYTSGHCKFGQRCAYLHIRRLPVFQNIVSNETLM